MESSYSAAEHFRQGETALAQSDHGAALEHFRSAHRLEPSARNRSYYGMALALAERRFDQALELCRSAAKEEFFNPCLYRNLALVHLAFGFKAEAIRFLRRGLMIDPDNAAIQEDLERLGQRRHPPLGFLRRRHMINRWLGLLRGRFGGQRAENPARG
jgi:tetratricopeptide (TPR) repeat protein